MKRIVILGVAAAIGVSVSTTQSEHRQHLATDGPEARSYTAISNIMKTKHDTVKNSISNIR